MNPNSIPSTEGRPPVVVIIGPTGIGKTSIAIQTASRVGGEIVSADSRQVYRYMDIGTAKPTLAERQQAHHHLVDFLLPDETLTLAQYQKMAFDVLSDIHARGMIPLIVGGTGQYVRAVIEGWGIPEVAPQPIIRDQLQALADRLGSTYLHDRLSTVDPVAARKIDHRNVRRVIRALEVYEVTGKPISALQERTPPPYAFHVVGLTRPRESLYQRIDRRIDAMIRDGLREEVKGLLDRGYNWELPSMSGLGYAQFQPHFVHNQPLEDVVVAIKHDTRRFIRHQYNWFKPTDPDISWMDLEHETTELVKQKIHDLLFRAGSSLS